MEIDFDKMEVGDKIKLPPGRWGEELRELYTAANAYVKDNKGKQFEFSGNDGSALNKGQYWIERVK